MCRYSDHAYRSSFACLKHRHLAQFPQGEQPLCPVCRQAMVELGRDFAAPRKQDDRQWRKLELLIAAGVRFDSCGCDGPGARPHTLPQAREFLAELPVRRH